MTTAQTPPKMRGDSLSAVVLTYFASDPEETHKTIAEDIAGVTCCRVLAAITSLKKRGLLVRGVGGNYHSPTTLGWAALKRMKARPKD